MTFLALPWEMMAICDRCWMSRHSHVITFSSCLCKKTDIQKSPRLANLTISVLSTNSLHAWVRHAADTVYHKSPEDLRAEHQQFWMTSSSSLHTSCLSSPTSSKICAVCSSVSWFSCPVLSKELWCRQQWHQHSPQRCRRLNQQPQEHPCCNQPMIYEQS